MSLFGALFTSVSGLDAQSTAMGIISNNIANVNTIGYKSSSASFSTLVTSDGSAGSGGVLANTNNTVDQQGTLQQTSSATDLAITGNGFFVVRQEPNASSPVLYTRAASLTENAAGYLTNAAGFTVYGWPLDSNGNIPAASSDISSLEPVNVASLGGNSDATTAGALSLNVDSTTATAGTFTQSMTVYDTLGAPETLNLTFTKTATANQWTLGVTDGAGNPLLPLVGGVHTVPVDFNSNGAISQVGAVAGVTALSVAGAAGGGILWGNGSSAQTINLDLSSVTQFDSANNAISVTQNGAALGLRTGVSIDSNGIVSATFSNGTTAKIYQLPIATFSDPDGLNEASGDAYSESSTSGVYNLRIAGDSGAGTVSPDSLEQSNVDLGTEFSNMIITQRAYAASSKVISTVDQMLQSLLEIQ